MEDIISVVFKLAGYYQIEIPMKPYRILLTLQDPYAKGSIGESVAVFHHAEDITGQFIKGSNKTNIRPTAKNLRYLLSIINRDIKEANK
jgi:hypothetical protein